MHFVNGTSDKEAPIKKKPVSPKRDFDMTCSLVPDNSQGTLYTYEAFLILYLRRDSIQKTMSGVRKPKHYILCFQCLYPNNMHSIN